MPCANAALPICSAVRPLHLEQLAPADLDRTPASGDEDRAQALGLRRANPHCAARRAVDDLVDARVGDQPAAADHDQVVGGERHLAHQMRRDEHGATFCGERPEEVADPVDAFGVEAVHRLVEQQRGGIAEQRRRDSEPLPHPERELPGALARHVVQADEVDQLVDPALADPVRLREREQVVVGGAARVHRARLEEGSDLVQRRRVVAVVLAVHGDVAAARRVEPEDQAHRRRLARAVRTEEPGHDARLDGEA